MSSLRRILAVGLPAAGLTAFTALALSGAPALAATGDQTVARPLAAATEEPVDDRGGAGYGNEAPTTAPTGTVATTPTGTVATVPTGAAPTETTPTRGRPGYGTPSAATTTPTANTDTVPPSVSPSSITPSPAVTTPGGGVSAGHLPVTGSSTGTVVTVGGLLVAAGAASVWYTRRRRNA